MLNYDLLSASITLTSIAIVILIFALERNVEGTTQRLKIYSKNALANLPSTGGNSIHVLILKNTMVFTIVIFFLSILSAFIVITTANEDHMNLFFSIVLAFLPAVIVVLILDFFIDTVRK